MNTIKYKELQEWYLNDTARETAKEVFGDRQPSIFRTGFYSSPSWNWGYQLGLVKVGDSTYDVAIQFGSVVGARLVHIPEMRGE